MVISAIKKNLRKALFENDGQYRIPKGELTRFRALMNDLTWRLPSMSKPDSLRGLSANDGSCLY